MAYQVNKFNGTFLVSVADGTIDASTDLRFVGKNYAGYGQVQNENFLHLLEHFAGSSQPPRPLTGQLWFDTTDKKIKAFDGVRFKLVGGATSSASAPAGLTAGEFWFDSIAQQLYCWTGSEYTLIGPENPASLGETSVTTQVIKDDTGLNRTIAKFQSGGTVVAIVSKDTFNINSSLNPIPGFTGIKKGITLVDTNDAGLTSLASSAVIWGTASTSNALVEPTTGNLFTINDLVKVATPSFASQVSLSTNGLTLGPAGSNVFSLTLENASDAVLQNQSGNNIKFKIRVDATETKTIADVTQTGIMPGLPSAYDLGSDTVRWYRIYANNIAGNLTGNVIGNVTGSLTGNVTGNVTGNLLGNVTGNVTGELFGNASTATSATKLKDAEASTTATASSIVQRDASANITANKFIGIADFTDRLKIDNSAVDDVASSYKSAKTTKTANTIAARDSAGNIAANIFNGTATSVEGADLAEKYLADAEYSVGTVVIVGGEKEVTASSWGKRAIGVVSGNPGLMMNQSLDNGTYIALKGRVPVRVIGTVHKGDNLIASNNGCAVAAVHHSSEVFAVALETNVNTEEKIIEAIVL